MKIQILWVLPSEQRFHSGDILTDAELRDLGADPQALLDANEAQILEADAPKPIKGKAKK